MRRSVLWVGLVLAVICLVASGCDSRKSAPRRAVVQKKEAPWPASHIAKTDTIIWSVTKANGRTPGVVTVIRPDITIMRCFKCPVSAKHVDGTLYAMAADQPRRDLDVYVCPSGWNPAAAESWLGDSHRPQYNKRLGSSRISVSVPKVAKTFDRADDIAGGWTAVRPARFSIDCRLKKGEYYWLVVKPTWEESERNKRRLMRVPDTDYVCDRFLVLRSTRDDRTTKETGLLAYFAMAQMDLKDPFVSGENFYEALVAELGVR